MRRVFTAAAVALCALVLVASPAAAQYPPVQPPENVVVAPGDDVVVVEDDGHEGTAVAGASDDREALAYTGFEVTTGALLGALAVGLGTMVLVASRRRSRASVDHG